MLQVPHLSPPAARGQGVEMRWVPSQGQIFKRDHQQLLALSMWRRGQILHRLQQELSASEIWTPLVAAEMMASVITLHSARHGDATELPWLGYRTSQPSHQVFIDPDALSQQWPCSPGNILEVARKRLGLSCPCSAISMILNNPLRAAAERGY